MPKRRKDKTLHRGPFTAADFDKHLRRVGYVKRAGGKHLCYTHPDRPGKVTISTAWTSIRWGDPIFKNIAE